MSAVLHLPALVAETMTNAIDPLTSSFLGLDPDKRFVLMIVGIGCVMAAVIATIGILSGVADQMHRRRMEADMKRELLDRGLNVDEVVKIIRAAPETGVSRWFSSWGKCDKH
jgi:hypothetical protein